MRIDNLKKIINFKSVLCTYRSDYHLPHPSCFFLDWMVTHTKPHSEKVWRVRDIGNFSIFVLYLPSPYPQGSGIYAKEEGEISKSRKW